MITYVIEDNGKTHAQVGCHDDTVMATAILLQLLLEGKHDNYVPEIPIDQRGKNRAREVVDPLFEEVKENIVVSILGSEVMSKLSEEQREALLVYYCHQTFK